MVNGFARIFTNLQSVPPGYKFKAVVFGVIFCVVPLDYREDSKYCFYELTPKDKQTVGEALQYLIGGLEYRIDIFYDFLNQLRIVRN